MKFLFLITFFMMAAFVFANPPQHGHNDHHPKSGHGAVGHGGGHGSQGGHGGGQPGHGGAHGWQPREHHGHH